MKRSLVALILVLGLAAAIPAFADVVPPFTPAPGVAVTPIGIDPTTAGTIVADTGAVSFSFGGPANNKNTGAVREFVVQLADSTLAFVFQVSVTGGPTGDITRISTGDWDNAIGINALQFQGSGDVMASGVDRNGLGTVGINFITPLVTQGHTSWEVILLTDATQYTAGTIGLIDSGSNPSIPGFVAAVGTPEPATLSLLAIGLLGLGALRKKR